MKDEGIRQPRRPMSKQQPRPSFVGTTASCFIVLAGAAGLPLARGASLRASSISFERRLEGGAFPDVSRSLNASEELALLQSSQPGGVPSSFWAGVPTPAPPALGPGPYPYMMWVEQKPLPLPSTTPPVYEQCHGCHCVFVFPEGFLEGGKIADKYTCHGGAPTSRVPNIKWVGRPGQDLIKPDGSSCPNCASWAITIDDLDFPNGNGELNNDIRSIFWAVNIPGDWTDIDDARAFDEKNGVIVGMNGAGTQGFDAPCPKKGTHRYKVTLWSLSSYLGSEAQPYSTSTHADKLKTDLEAIELARATFYGSLSSPGYQR